MDFLYTLSKAASDQTQMFLPASTSSPLRPVQHFPGRWYGNRQQRGQRLAAIRASLPGDIVFETVAMGQVINKLGRVSRICLLKYAKVVMVMVVASAQFFLLCTQVTFKPEC